MRMQWPKVYEKGRRPSLLIATCHVHNEDGLRTQPLDRLKLNITLGPTFSDEADREADVLAIGGVSFFNRDLLCISTRKWEIIVRVVHEDSNLVSNGVCMPCGNRDCKERR